MFQRILLLSISLLFVNYLSAQKVFKGKFTIKNKGYKVEYFTSRVYIGKNEIHISEPDGNKTYKIKKKMIDGPWKVYKVKNFFIKEMPDFVKVEYGRNNFVMYCLHEG